MVAIGNELFKNEEINRIDQKPACRGHVHLMSNEITTNEEQTMSKSADTKKDEKKKPTKTMKEKKAEKKLKKEAKRA